MATAQPSPVPDPEASAELLRLRLQHPAKAATTQLAMSGLPAEPDHYTAEWHRAHRKTADGIAVALLAELRWWSACLERCDEYGAQVACLPIGGLAIQDERAFAAERGWGCS